MSDVNNVDELDMEMPVILLNDDEGDEVPFELLDVIEYEGEEYVVLLPLSEEDEPGEVVILKIQPTDSDEEEEYVGIEDEALLMQLFGIFKEKFKDDFNFVD